MPRNQSKFRQVCSCDFSLSIFYVIFHFRFYVLFVVYYARRQRSTIKITVIDIHSINVNNTLLQR